MDSYPVLPENQLDVLSRGAFADLGECGGRWCSERLEELTTQIASFQPEYPESPNNDEFLETIRRMLDEKERGDPFSARCSLVEWGVLDKHDDRELSLEDIVAAAFCRTDRVLWHSLAVSLANQACHDSYNDKLPSVIDRLIIGGESDEGDGHVVSEAFQRLKKEFNVVLDAERELYLSKNTVLLVKGASDFVYLRNEAQNMDHQRTERSVEDCLDLIDRLDSDMIAEQEYASELWKEVRFPRLQPPRYGIFLPCQGIHGLSGFDYDSYSDEDVIRDRLRVRRDQNLDSVNRRSQIKASLRGLIDTDTMSLLGALVERGKGQDCWTKDILEKLEMLLVYDELLQSGIFLEKIASIRDYVEEQYCRSEKIFVPIDQKNPLFKLGGFIPSASLIQESICVNLNKAIPQWEDVSTAYLFWTNTEMMRLRNELYSRIKQSILPCSEVLINLLQDKQG